jgi:preprotein translocase subunit SecE
MAAAADPCALEPTSPTTTESESSANAVKQAPNADAGAEMAEEEWKTEGFGAATIAELRKVVWPSRQQLFSESVAVILMVSLSAAAIASVDRLFSWVARLVFR